jgi:hypothetical protein
MSSGAAPDLGEHDPERRLAACEPVEPRDQLRRLLGADDTIQLRAVAERDERGHGSDRQLPSGVLGVVDVDLDRNGV